MEVYVGIMSRQKPWGRHGLDFGKIISTCNNNNMHQSLERAVGHGDSLIVPSLSESIWWAMRARWCPDSWDESRVWFIIALHFIHFLAFSGCQPARCGRHVCRSLRKREAILV